MLVSFPRIKAHALLTISAITMMTPSTSADHSYMVVAKAMTTTSVPKKSAIRAVAMIKIITSTSPVTATSLGTWGHATLQNRAGTLTLRGETVWPSTMEDARAMGITSGTMRIVLLSAQGVSEKMHLELGQSDYNGKW